MIDEARARKIARAASATDCSSGARRCAATSAPAATAARSSPSEPVMDLPLTLVAIRCSTVLTSNGRSPGCAPSTRAAIAAMCGVANELPEARIVVPPAQATSTSSPRAWNSTGGRGLEKNASGSGSAWLPTDSTEAKRHGQLSTGMLCAEATSDHATEVRLVDERAQRVREPRLGRREAEVHDLVALRDRPPQPGDERVAAAGEVRARARGRW